MSDKTTTTDKGTSKTPSKTNSKEILKAFITYVAIDARKYRVNTSNNPLVPTQEMIDNVDNYYM